MGADPLKIGNKESAYLAENASLKNQVETLRCALDQQEQRLSGMVRIAANLTQSLDPSEAMKSIIDDISELLDADRTTIYEIRPDEAFLRGLAVQGSGRLEVGIPLGKGIAGKVAQLNRSLNLKNAYKHPDFDPKVDKLTGYRTHSMLCVPMRNPRQQVIGVVQVLNKRSSSYFSVEDEALLSALASQAAITLEALHLQLRLNISNTELTDLSIQLQRRIQDMGLLYRAERELGAAPELGTLGSSAMRFVSELRSCRHVALSIIDKEHQSAVAATLDVERDIVEWGSVELGDGVLGRSINRPNVLQLSGDVFDQQDIPRRLGGGFDVKVEDALVMQLRVAEEVVGSLVMVNFLDPLSLGTPPPVKLFELLGAQIARTAQVLLRREVEQQQDRLSTIGQMLSGLLHDLKGPMSVISGYSQLMVQMKEQMDRADAAQRIRRQVNTFDDMTKEVIAFARGDRRVIKQKVALTDFLSQFEEATIPEYESAEMSLEIKLADTRFGYFDAKRMLRVLTNVARNARQAMEPGGRFDVCVSTAEDGGLVFELTDNGPGVPDGIKDRLFDLFTTAGKSDGTGLGLAIVKRIVDDHGGKIKFTSNEGLGTSFKIWLPPYVNEVDDA